MIDPGHGGHDAGAVGPGGLQEKELSLDIARRVAALLQEELGVRVVLTRARDQFVGLRERTALANRERADLFLSIHVNAAPDGAATGTETYFLSNEATDGAARRAAEYENRLIAADTGARGGSPDVLRSILWDLAQSDFQQESSRVAEALQNNLDRALRRPSRGVKQAPFYVLGGAAMPAVLVEIGFISNPQEEQRLRDDGYRDRIARALVAGVTAYKRSYDQRVGVGGEAMTRHDGRAPGDLRPVRLTRRYTRHAEGAVLVEVGDTRVICTASVEDRVPPFLRGSGQGWVTAEYGMLPRATSTRTGREAGRTGGRTHEIQRLVGRSLRAVVQLTQLGERTITVDCDVIQADGGTRTAAITGGYVALADALQQLRESGRLLSEPLRDLVAATSVGVVLGTPVVDLDYVEDSTAEVDMNVVMTGAERFVEVQGTAERTPFDQAQLDGLLGLARQGVARLLAFQRRVLADRTTAVFTLP